MRKSRLFEIVPVAGTQILAMVLRYLLLLAVARLLSVSQFGVYALISAILVWFSVVAAGGWPAYMMASVPKAGIGRAQLRRVELRLTCIAALASLGLALVLWLALRDEFRWWLPLGAGSILIGMTVATVVNETHRATGRVLSSRLLFSTVPPLTALALLFGIYRAIGSVTLGGVMISVAAGWVALWVVARAVISYHVLEPQLGYLPHFNRRDFLVLKLSQSFLASGDVFIVGVVAGVEATALYAVATRVATFAGLGLNAVTMLYAPRISRAVGDASDLRRVTRLATRLSWALTVPLVSLLILAAPFILRSFGSDYHAAYPILIVLLVGGAISALFGPVGTVANVNGQERLSRNVMMGSAFLFLVTMPLSTWHFGPIGAAACWSTITLIWNFVIWRRLNYANRPHREAARGGG